MGVIYELLDEKIKSESRVFLKGLILIPEGQSSGPILPFTEKWLCSGCGHAVQESSPGILNCLVANTFRQGTKQIQPADLLF